MRRVLLILAPPLLAWLGWEAGGLLVAWSGLDELDPLLRLGGVALALAVAERGVTAVSGAD